MKVKVLEIYVSITVKYGKIVYFRLRMAFNVNLY
jgi:hypothetical protein